MMSVPESAEMVGTAVLLPSYRLEGVCEAVSAQGSVRVLIDGPTGERPKAHKSLAISLLTIVSLAVR